MGIVSDHKTVRHLYRSKIAVLVKTIRHLPLIERILATEEPAFSVQTCIKSTKTMRIEIGGRPILDITNGDGKESITTTTTRRVKTNRQVDFKWRDTQPRLVVTSDTEDFDEETISHFQEEGYQIAYIHYDGDKAAYHQQLDHLADPLEKGEQYAIVGT